MKKIVVIAALLLAPWMLKAQDPDLELMNPRARVDFARSGEALPSRVVIRDSARNILKGFNLRYPVIDGEIYSAFDYYRNTAGKLVEIIVRKPATEDFDLIKKLYDIDEEQRRGSMVPYKPDCSQQRAILAEVYAAEKENRKNEQVIDAELDNALEAKVTGILQQCGAPGLSVAGGDGIRAIYDVLQHARRKNQEKYLDVLKTYIKNGSLRKNTLIVIEDKMLIASGQKQRYGTQIVFFVKTGYHVFPCEDPAHLDERRASVGLPPMETFVQEREEFYRAEINR